MRNDRRRSAGNWMVGIDWRLAGLCLWFAAGITVVGLGGGYLLAHALTGGAL